MATKSASGIEIGQNIAFQEKDWRMQRISWVIMAIFLVLGLAGLFGGDGPLSRVTVTSEGDGLEVSYDRLGHFMEWTTLEFVIDGVVGGSDEVELWLRQDYVDALNIDRTIPEPERVAASPERVVYTFSRTEPNAPVHVTFHFRPTQFGVIWGEVGVTNGSTLQLTHVFYP